MKKRKQENIDGVEHVFYEDMTKQVKELKDMVDSVKQVQPQLPLSLQEKKRKIKVLIKK